MKIFKKSIDKALNDKKLLKRLCAKGDDYIGKIDKNNLPTYDDWFEKFSTKNILWSLQFADDDVKEDLIENVVKKMDTNIEYDSSIEGYEIDVYNRLKEQCETNKEKRLLDNKIKKVILKELKDYDKKKK